MTHLSATSIQSIKVFYCYAQRDKALRDQLEEHLGGLQSHYTLINWHDHNISPGEDWERAVEMHLDTAHIILLLVSPAFLASDSCYQKMMRALERHKRGEARVIPILLRPAHWNEAPFSHLRALPDTGHPVTRWHNKDEAFDNITRGVEKVLREVFSVEKPALANFPRDASGQQKRREHIRAHLATARQEYVFPRQQQRRIKIDQNMIVSYDLDAQMAEFRKKLGYEGIFAFTVGGDAHILEHYVLARIKQELLSKTGRPFADFALQLYSLDNLSIEHALIEQKLRERKICESLPEWFDMNPGIDMVLVIWNYDVPPAIMRLIARSFWQAAQTQVAPTLQGQSRCFVVIWANIGTKKYFRDQSSIDLKIPTRFVVEELEQWFRGHLSQLNLEKEIVDWYLLRLRNQHGHLIGTYQEMYAILDDLQGRGNIV